MLCGRKKRLVIFFRWLSCWNPGPSSLLSSSACSCVSGHLLTPIRRNQRIPEMTLLRRNSPNTIPRWDTTSTSSRDNGEKDTLCVSDKCTCNYAWLLKIYVPSPHPSEIDQETVIKMISRWCRCTTSHYYVRKNDEVLQQDCEIALRSTFQWPKALRITNLSDKTQTDAPQRLNRLLICHRLMFLSALLYRTTFIYIFIVF